MRKGIGVRDSRGQINAIYLLHDEDLVSEENTFSRDEWERGIARMEWQVEVAKKVGTDYETVGNEFEDVGNGFVYRIFFVKKGSFMRKGINEIAEKYIREWELEPEKDPTESRDILS